MNNNGYEQLTPGLAIGLAAPQTWPGASIMPLLLGSALSGVLAETFSITMFIPLFLIVILMQSAVNTLNDYHDFMKGTDTPENSEDPNDAVLVYHRLNPNHVLKLGFAFLGLAGLLGAFVVFKSGILPLVVGAIGAATIICYSSIRRPLSYLPLGELVSGFVMGGLIPCGVYAAFTSTLPPHVLYFASPMMMGIALIMMTNNICDMNRDAQSGRRTLPLLLGLERSLFAYRFLLLLWLFLLILICFWYFRTGMAGLLILLTGGGIFFRLMKMDFYSEKRQLAMAAIQKWNIVTGFGYLAAIILSGVMV